MPDSPTVPAAASAEHLAMLRQMAQWPSQCEDICTAQVKALRWAIARIEAADASAPLTISQALRLARDEGRLVRCRGWPEYDYLWWDRRSIRYFSETQAARPHYEPTLSDCLAEWEVLPDA